MPYRTEYRTNCGTPKLNIIFQEWNDFNCYCTLRSSRQRERGNKEQGQGREVNLFQDVIKLFTSARGPQTSVI